MEEKEQPGGSSSWRESQSFRQNDAGTFVAKRQPTQHNAVESGDGASNSDREPNPLEVAMKVWEFFREPKHANAIMAIFTILIFLATGAYAWVAIKQWSAMLDSNRITREAFETDRKRTWCSGIFGGG